MCYHFRYFKDYYITVLMEAFKNKIWKAFSEFLALLRMCEHFQHFCLKASLKILEGGHDG